MKLIDEKELLLSKLAVHSVYFRSREIVSILSLSVVLEKSVPIELHSGGGRRPFRHEVDATRIFW